jgi:hypothetical protein
MHVMKFYSLNLNMDEKDHDMILNEIYAYIYYYKNCVNGFMKQCGALVCHIWKLNGDGWIIRYSYLQSDFAFGPCFTPNPHFAPNVCTHKINKFDQNMVFFFFKCIYYTWFAQ